MNPTPILSAVPAAGALPAALRAPTRPATPTAHWARHLDEVREAQRLRFRVFAGEMGARIDDTALPGHDCDRFDPYCEHLLVREGEGGRVIGTYRLLTPAQARRAGGLYSDSGFDLAPLDALRPQLVELGRSCVHPDHRGGAVVLALWGALASFMAANRLAVMVGSASIPMQPGAAAAARVAHLLQARAPAPPALRVVPRCALPPDAPGDGIAPEPPALIQGYLRLGARVLGPPAWDPAFNTADLPMLLRMADLPARYRRHWLGS